MTLKPGVRILGVKPEIVLAMHIVERVYSSRGHDLRITSVVEGKHSRGSIHYQGLAFDCGVKDQGVLWSIEERKAMTATLKDALGADFDVVLESDHVHIEFQPKDPL